MLRKYKILNEIHKSYLVAVVRGENKEDAIEIANHAYIGGIRLQEITFTTPKAEEVIYELSRNKDKEMIIGAGTVLDVAIARIAIMNGASFIVSPHFDKEIALLCNTYATPYLPGCGSVAEIIDAIKYGTDVIKLFPGGLLGPTFIQDVHGPLPNVQIMPSGGVSIDNIQDWVTSGSYAVGIGSALTKEKTDGDYSSVEKVARQFVDKLHMVWRSNT